MGVKLGLVGLGAFGALRRVGRCYLIDTRLALYGQEQEFCIVPHSRLCRPLQQIVDAHPFPLLVREFQRVIGIEAREQFFEMTGEMPDNICACVGGGSNAAGFFHAFIDDPVEIYGVEPLGRGTKLGEHACSLAYGTEGIMHGFNSIMLKDENGDPAPVYSAASGLDYPSVGPEHAYWHEIGREKAVSINDDEAVTAFFQLSRLEGIIPALESAHAVAFATKLAKERPTESILVNLSGRGDKDLDFVMEKFGHYADREY